MVCANNGKIPNARVFILSLRAIKIQRREIWTKMGWVGWGWGLSRKLINIEIQTQRKYFWPGG